MGRTKLFLGHVPHSARQRDIEDFFRGYGRINDVKLKTGFAFIEFERRRDAKDAVKELDGVRLLGERVTVELARQSSHDNGTQRFEDKETASRSYSRGSRSRSRSHRKHDRSRSRDYRKRRSDSSRRERSRDRRENKENKDKRAEVSYPTTSRASHRSRSRSPSSSKARKAKKTEREAKDKRSRSRSRSPTVSRADRTETNRSRSAAKHHSPASTSSKKCKREDDEDEWVVRKIGKSNEGNSSCINPKSIDSPPQSATEKKTIFSHTYYFNLSDSSHSWQTKILNDDALEICELVEGLKRWSTSVCPDMIEINIQDDPDVNISGAIKALLQFNADRLIVHTMEFDQFRAEFGNEFDLPQLEFATMFSMTRSFREVFIDHHICTAIDGIDLSILWRTLSEGGCKLESFSAKFDGRTVDQFLKACFDITIVYHSREGRLELRRNEKLHPVQLYSTNSTFPEIFIHFNGDLKTEIDGKRVFFKRIDEQRKLELIESLYEIELNHTYYE